MMETNGELFNYESYFQWVANLVENKQTSGNTQSEASISFTYLNLKRMKRLNKTIVLNDEIKNSISLIDTKQIWYVITEAWCGDSAQIIPVIGKIAELSNNKIELRIILRDNNPSWLDKYHTNGTRSIPKIIVFDMNRKELFTWGPRPKEAHKILTEWKLKPNDRTHDDFEKELHTWYAKDKTQSIQKELAQLLVLTVEKLEV